MADHLSNGIPNDFNEEPLLLHNHLKGSIEQKYSSQERSYHLGVVIKMAFMAAMGGFLFG